MATFKANHAKAEKASDSAKVTSIRKISASSSASSQKEDAPHGDQIQSLGLDPNGNCKINIFSPVRQGNTMLQYPYSRCYVVESTASSVNIEQRPGNITVARSYQTTELDGSITTTFDSHTAFSWHLGVTMRMKRILVSVTLITRNVPEGTLETGSNTRAPRRITNGSVAEWYVTDLGGWIGRYNNADFWDFLPGSPIFVTEESGAVDRPWTTKAWLVGLVTDEVVASSPCTVNAGLFVHYGAVKRFVECLVGGGSAVGRESEFVPRSDLMQGGC